MKRSILMAMAGCICMVMCGCSSEKSPWQGFQQVAPSRVAYGIINVDGCEYIFINGKYGFSHKGNCKNPEHGTTRETIFIEKKSGKLLKPVFRHYT